VQDLMCGQELNLQYLGQPLLSKAPSSHLKPQLLDKNMAHKK